MYVMLNMLPLRYFGVSACLCVVLSVSYACVVTLHGRVCLCGVSPFLTVQKGDAVVFDYIPIQAHLTALIEITVSNFT